MSNFWTRTLSAIVFTIVMVFGLIWDRGIFACLFVTILVVALHEFYTMALGKRFHARPVDAFIPPRFLHGPGRSLSL